MDFYAAQDLARRNTRRLLILYACAVAVLILLTNVAIVFGLWLLDEQLFGAWLYTVHAPAMDGARPPAGLLDYLTTPLMLGTCVVVICAVGLASLWKSAQLAQGGKVVAEMLGGVLLAPDTQAPQRRRLLNIVEEMAIAAAMPVPPVYVLPESGINAFAAGYSTDDAVIGITEGALQQLDRDELQGVIGHEISHVLNGDMRLNMRLIAMLHGILFIAHTGRVLLDLRGDRDIDADDRRSLVPQFVVGLALVLIGSGGALFGRLIKAGVSRQREWLADASAVQFTRQPRGLASALSRIGGIEQQGILRAAGAEEASHLYFSQGVVTRLHSLFATHPPLRERIRRIDPGWNGRFLPARAAFSQLPESSPAEGEPDTSASSLGISALTGPSAPQGDPGPAAALALPLPLALREACRSAEAAPGVLLACLIDRHSEGAAAQLALLGAQAPLLARSVMELADTAALNATGGTLPLIELCMPAIKQLAPGTREALWQLVRKLVALDGRIDLREMVISVYLQRHLVPAPGDLREVRARYSRLEQLQGPLSLLFSGLAHAVHHQPGEAGRAFTAACTAARVDGLRLIDAAAIDWPSLYAALWRLRSAYPLLKPRIIKGCRAVLGVQQGEQSAAQALELLELVAAVLDCALGEPEYAD